MKTSKTAITAFLLSMMVIILFDLTHKPETKEMKLYKITANQATGLDSIVPAWNIYQAAQRFTRLNPESIILSIASYTKADARAEKVIVNQWQMKDPSYPQTRPRVIK